LPISLMYSRERGGKKPVKKGRNEEKRPEMVPGSGQTRRWVEQKEKPEGGSRTKPHLFEKKKIGKEKALHAFHPKF